MKTEVLREKRVPLPLCAPKSHTYWPEIEWWRPRWEADDWPFESV